MTNKMTNKWDDRKEFYTKMMNLDCKSNPDVLKIMKMCVENNFYEHFVCKQILRLYSCKGIKYILRDWGFIIYTNYPAHENTILIDFLFILPEHRRKGITTKMINIFKKNKDIVIMTIDRNNIPMNTCALKNEFRPIAECRSEVENFWGWSDKYDDDYIYEKCY